MTDIRAHLADLRFVPASNMIQAIIEFFTDVNYRPNRRLDIWQKATDRERMPVPWLSDCADDD